jgi:hypothetical protein
MKYSSKMHSDIRIIFYSHDATNRVPVRGGWGVGTPSPSNAMYEPFVLAQ